jgi:hypothetical protein
VRVVDLEHNVVDTAGVERSHAVVVTQEASRDLPVEVDGGSSISPPVATQHVDCRERVRRVTRHAINLERFLVARQRAEWLHAMIRIP